MRHAFVNARHVRRHQPAESDAAEGAEYPNEQSVEQKDRHDAGSRSPDASQNADVAGLFVDNRPENGHDQCAADEVDDRKERPHQFPFLLDRADEGGILFLPGQDAESRISAQ